LAGAGEFFNKAELSVHEFSICEGILQIIQEEIDKLEKPVSKVLLVKLVIGELRQVVPDYLRFAFETLTSGTPAEGAVLDIRITPIIAQCKECAWRGEAKATFIKCPECGSPDLVVHSGRELMLAKLEVEVNEEAGD
jgi:hydrogenase nickel incorporation protein HypA/HybF